MTLSLCMKCTVGMPVAAVSGLLGQDYAQGTGQDIDERWQTPSCALADSACLAHG